MLSHQRPCCARMDKNWQVALSIYELHGTSALNLLTRAADMGGAHPGDFYKSSLPRYLASESEEPSKADLWKTQWTFALSLSFVSLGWKQMFLLVWHVLHCYLLRVRCVSCRRWGVRSSQHPHLESECLPLLCCCEGRERIFFVQCR